MRGYKPNMVAAAVLTEMQVLIVGIFTFAAGFFLGWALNPKVKGDND